MHFPSPTSFSTCISTIQDFPQDKSLLYVTIYLDTFLICHTSEGLKDIGFSGNTIKIFPPHRTHSHQQCTVITPVTVSETFHKEHV